MNATLSSRRKRAAAVSALGGVLLVAAGLGYRLLTPQTYVASATVRVWKSSANNVTNHAGEHFDPAAILPGECQFIRSQVLLDPVIEKLDLNHDWGKRFNQGVALSNAETRQRLLTVMSAEPAAEAGIITVSVTTGDNPAQAVAIANEIVQAYETQRDQERDEAVRAPVTTIDQQAAELDSRVNEAESNLAALAKRINFGPATNSAKYFSPELYNSAQSNRAVLQANFDKQKLLVTELKPMNGPALVDAAAALDDSTNAVLAPAVNKWKQAEARLARAETTEGTNSQAAREAAAETDELAAIAEQTARSLVTAREAQLSGLNAELAAFNEQLAGATTNLEEFIAAHPDYRDALRKYEALKARRKDLQQKLVLESLQDSPDATPQETLNVKVVELADAPSQPATPNRKVCTGLVAGGLFLCVAGVGLQFIKPARRRK